MLFGLEDLNFKLLKGRGSGIMHQLGCLYIILCDLRTMIDVGINIVVHNRKGGCNFFLVGFNHGKRIKEKVANVCFVGFGHSKIWQWLKEQEKKNSKLLCYFPSKLSQWQHTFCTHCQPSPLLTKTLHPTPSCEAQCEIS